MIRREAGPPGRGTALLWGAIAEICAGGGLATLLMSPGARSAAFFGPDGSVAALTAALCVTTVLIVAALILGTLPRTVRWGLAFPGVLTAGVVGAMGLGSLASGLVFLLLPAAVGIYIVSMYVARQRIFAVRG